MMASLISLPQELLHQIAQELGAGHQSSLYSLALTCSSLYAAAEHALYLDVETHLTKGCTPGWDALALSRQKTEKQARREHTKCRQLLQTLQKNPRLARNMRGLTVTSMDSCDKSMPSRTHLCDQDCLGLLQTMRSSRLAKLKVQYPICCTFLNHQFHLLEHLTVQPSQGTRGNGQPFILDLGFLPTILQSPRLKSLNLAAAWVRNLDALECQSFQLLYRSSSVRSISLDIGNISEKALGNLIHASMELESFKMCPSIDFEPSKTRTGDELWGRVDSLPKLSATMKYLGIHAQTLQQLTLRRGHGHWHPNLDTIGSLQPYTRLRELAVEVETLLGWRHCEHQTQQDVTRPLELASLLPESLETLHLTFSDFHHYRNGCYYAYDIAEGIAIDRARLSKLNRVRFSIDDGENGAYRYCNVCERLMENNQHARLRRSSMSMLEVLDIRAVLLNAGIAFEYRPAKVEMAWLLSDWGYPVNNLENFENRFPEEASWLRELLKNHGHDIPYFDCMSWKCQ